MSSAGLRNKFVTLEGPTSEPDGEGGTLEGWGALDPANEWVSINPATQADLERAASGTVLSTASHIIELPYRPDVNVQTRLRYTPLGRPERIFQVTSVRNPEEADRDLVLVAEEIVL